MFRFSRIFLISILCRWITACAESDNTVPRVIKTSPVNGDLNVDPSTSQLVVTFNEEMADNSWSWAYADKDFLI